MPTNTTISARIARTNLRLRNAPAKTKTTTSANPTEDLSNSIPLRDLLFGPEVHDTTCLAFQAWKSSLLNQLDFSTYSQGG